MIFFGPDTMTPRFCGEKSALLHIFARQRTKCPLFCEAKNEVSVILRGNERSLRYFSRRKRKRSEVCIAPQFYRAKSALLQKYIKKLYVLNSLKYILVFQQSIAPWWQLFRKEINCRTVPMLYIIHCTLYSNKKKLYTMHLRLYTINKTL